MTPTVEALVDDGTVTGERDGWIKICLCGRPERDNDPHCARIMGSAWLEWSGRLAPPVLRYKGEDYGFWMGVGGTYLYVKGWQLRVSCG